MCIHTYIGYVYIYIYICLYIYIYIYIYTCITYVHVHIYVCMYSSHAYYTDTVQSHSATTLYNYTIHILQDVASSAILMDGGASGSTKAFVLLALVLQALVLLNIII